MLAKVFLETTIFRKKLLGSQYERNQIEQAIKNKIAYTSTFVLSEFRRAIIFSLIEIYFLIYNCQNEPPTDALLKFQKIYSNSPRMIKAMSDLVTDILKFGGLPSDSDQALIWLETYIRNLENTINSLFRRENLINQSQCNVGNAILSLSLDPLEDLSNYYNSLKCPAMCCKKTYLLRRSDKLVKAYKSNNEHFKKTIYNYKSRKEFFNSLLPLYSKFISATSSISFDEINYLRDTIISLECPMTTTLITYDNIFQILCELYEKDFYIIPTQPTRMISALATPPILS